VQDGLGFHATQDPQAGISFRYIHNVTIDKEADSDLNEDDRKEYFCDPAIRLLGFSADWKGVTDYVESIRTRFNTRRTYAGMLTKYPVYHFAYTDPGGSLLVMDYSNDGWAPIIVFAHETGHVFNCPDEYAGSGCDCGGSWGRYGIGNHNCEPCAAERGVRCVMKNNDWEMCEYTRTHLGWSRHRVLNNSFNYANGWRVEKHLRFVADINGDRRAGIVGFGEDGVCISLAQDGSYAAPRRVTQEFGYALGWRIDNHPRFLADTTVNGLLNIIGFADDGVRI
jgi:M6 family metalloprotease-like protein